VDDVAWERLSFQGVENRMELREA
jgi:hypothetical protein